MSKVHEAKIKWFWFAIVFMLCAVIAQPQDATDELFSAQRVRDSVTLLITKDSTRVSIDGGADKPAKSPHSLVAGGSFQVRLERFNPLAMSITTTVKETDDPSYEAVNSFIEQISGLQATIRSEAEEATTDGRFGSLTGLDFKSPTIVNWLLFANLSEYRSCLDTDSSKPPGHGLVPLVTELSKYDTNYFQGSGGYLKRLSEALPSWTSSTYWTHEAQYTGASSLQAQIASMANEREHMKDSGVWKSEYDKLSWTNSTECNTFKTLTGNFVRSLSRESKEIKTRLDGIEKELRGFLTSLNKHETNWVGQDNKFYRIFDVEANAKKVQEVDVVLKQRAYSLEDGALTSKSEERGSAKLRVRKFTRFVPEVTAGIVSTDLEIPLYGTETEDGVTRVASAGIEQQDFEAALLLNLLLRAGGPSAVHPAIQVGIGTGKEKPSVLLGLSVRVTRRFSIGLGGLVTWYKDLDKLSVGDEISGTADLEADLTLVRSPAKLYLSLSFNL